MNAKATEHNTNGQNGGAAVRSGGRALVDALKLHGVERVFCVPGESYLEVLDALHDTPDIELIVAKHEGGAANMAEADGKLTGKPGICMVTRGPGATHASIGVHIAQQDSTPMILFIGQIARDQKGREAFQEVDYVPSVFRKSWRARFIRRFPGVPGQWWCLCLKTCWLILAMPPIVQLRRFMRLFPRQPQ
jgi:hypothetical protein